VVIFMKRQLALLFTGSNAVVRFALRSWWSMPISVATSTVDAVLRRAASSMAPVDSTWVRSAGSSPCDTIHRAEVVHPHSGCT
jgi:hypothetical protein